MAYTDIDNPDEHFQITLWTGNSSTPRTISNGEFKPDFLWMFHRSNAGSCPGCIFNSTVVPGQDASAHGGNANGKYTGLMSYWDGALGGMDFYRYGYLSGLTSTGFTCTAGTDGSVPMYRNNQNGYTYVAWQWKANGGTTTSFSENGNHPGGLRQTNTDAGFSLITYTGTGANANCEIAHGLPSTPEMVIFKRMDAANYWATYHKEIGDDNKLALQLNEGLDADGAFMNSTIPDSTNITVGGTSVHTNANNGKYICFAWSPIKGYSHFGSYLGNANANGPMVHTGFKPAWVMVKGITSNGYHWRIHDNKRDPQNEVQERVSANSSDAAYSGTSGNDYMDFLSNGFKLRSTRSDMNVAKIRYIYMAFAENPFVSSTGVPTTAR
jgi:hypothetical protein